MARWSANEWLQQHPEVKIARGRVAPGYRGAYLRRGARGAMLVDERLDRRGWKAVVAHEAAHHERGGGAEYDGQPPTWDAVVEREEATCNGIAAERCIDMDELVAWIQRRNALDEGTTVDDIAEAFDQPTWIARAAAKLVEHPSMAWRFR